MSTTLDSVDEQIRLLNEESMGGELLSKSKTEQLHELLKIRRTLTSEFNSGDTEGQRAAREMTDIELLNAMMDHQNDIYNAEKGTNK